MYADKLAVDHFLQETKKTGCKSVLRSNCFSALTRKTHKYKLECLRQIKRAHLVQYTTNVERVDA